ncbi:MAG TPA: DUF1579 family protein [Thermoanaerobaculia bacterium]|nr:DUF1579 family protein [Thermoanaerobaculia bacterium]
MKRRLVTAVLVSLLAAAATPATDATDGPKKIFQDDLLERLVGQWTITRKIRGTETQSRATARWVLHHQFLEIHLKDVAKPSAYEAIVLIGFRHADQKYVIHWCDTFGGKFSSRGLGRREGDAIAFEFPYEDGPFYNTFTFNRESGSWTSLMENSGEGGKRVFFAEDTYRRP